MMWYPFSFADKRRPFDACTHQQIEIQCRGYVHGEPLPRTPNQPCETKSKNQQPEMRNKKQEPAMRKKSRQRGTKRTAVQNKKQNPILFFVPSLSREPKIKFYHTKCECFAFCSSETGFLFRGSRLFVPGLSREPKIEFYHTKCKCFAFCSSFCSRDPGFLFLRQQIIALLFVLCFLYYCFAFCSALCSHPKTCFLFLRRGICVPTFGECGYLQQARGMILCDLCWGTCNSSCGANLPFTCMNFETGRFSNILTICAYIDIQMRFPTLRTSNSDNHKKNSCGLCGTSQIRATMIITVPRVVLYSDCFLSLKTDPKQKRKAEN